ncbi:MAG TPA: hypothetical protein VMV31_12730 [Terriglobales bacterium]|nr:hypothetical protein [Terriglobales bacterium]
MRAVGIKVLKNRLSEYVHLAAAGESVLVLDREQVVAELGPPASYRSRHIADERKAELVRRGIITPAAVVRQGPPPRTPVAPLSELLRGLDQDRADR